MKVVHFAQLDKDTILLCAESKQHLLLFALKTLCIKLHSSTIVTELSSASPWCVQVSATSRLHINLLILLIIMHTQPFNGPLSGTTEVSRYQKGKTNLDFTEARDSQWQWHQLGHMQVCTLLQTDNHASTPLLSFLQAGCPSCRPTNSIKALKALILTIYRIAGRSPLTYLMPAQTILTLVSRWTGVAWVTPSLPWFCFWNCPKKSLNCQLCICLLY